MAENEEDMDNSLAQKIEELAFTFRRKGLVADMDEALEKAKAIILGHTETTPFMGGHDPAVEELFNQESLPEEDHHVESSDPYYDKDNKEAGKSAAPPMSYVLNEAKEPAVQSAKDMPEAKEEAADAGDDAAEQAKEEKSAEINHYAPNVQQYSMPTSELNKESQSNANEPEIDAEERLTPLEELDPELRNLLIEMDHEIVEEQAHMPKQIITEQPIDESAIMRDFHLLDNYFEEDELKGGK